MKTIVSLALAGLMSISALLPALAAQEAENVSIPESSGISESVAQDESSVSSSGSTADESTEPESGSNAEDGSDSVAYAIGVVQPVMVEVDTFGTGTLCADDCLAIAVRHVFDLTPLSIIRTLQLTRPIFAKTACYGHFGRADFPWEREDRIKALQDAVL